MPREGMSISVPDGQRSFFVPDGRRSRSLLDRWRSFPVPREQTSISAMDEGMSPHVAVANAEHPAAGRPAQITFWEDGPTTRRDYRMLEVSAKGTRARGRHSASAGTASGPPPCGAVDSDDVLRLPPPSRCEKGGALGGGSSRA